MTFQIWVALHFLLTIGNRKSHWSDFHVVWTANHWTCLSQYRGVKYLAQKERNSILVRVAKLLRLSIYYWQIGRPKARKINIIISISNEADYLSLTCGLCFA